MGRRKPVTPAEIAAALNAMDAEVPYNARPITRHVDENDQVAEFVDGAVFRRYLAQTMNTKETTAGKWIMAASVAGEIVMLLARVGGRHFYRMAPIPENERVEAGPIGQWVEGPSEKLILNRFGHVVEDSRVTKIREPEENSWWVITPEKYAEVLKDVKARSEAADAKVMADHKAKQDKLRELHGTSIDTINEHMNRLGLKLADFQVEFRVTEKGKCLLDINLYDDQIDAFANSLPVEEK